MTKPSQLEHALLAIALDLSTSLPRGTHYQRLIAAINQVLPCEACALLVLKDGVLTPVAIDGLAPEVMHMNFIPEQHPRLNAILASHKPIRFAANTTLADPFDGLLLTDPHRKLDVHACMGCSLYVEDNLVGVLTLDSLDKDAFNTIDNITVATFAALAAATLRNASMLQALELQSERDRSIAKQMMQQAFSQKTELLGQSAAMAALRTEIQMVAISDLSVLITGETGTGKELVAKSVHAQSSRADKPLVHINCAALPESVAESELFGHVKGAFTDATSDRAGKFELADGGSLFLDEIGELPLSLQAKLLRALQQGDIQRVGSDSELTVDVRIIAATNRDLAKAVKKGQFRQDLYHRLCVYPINVPPLRERLSDIPALCGLFIQDAKRKLGIHQLGLSPDAMAQLSQYDWPGNVRELEHMLLRSSLKATRRNPEHALINNADLDLTTKPVNEHSALSAETSQSINNQPFNQQVDEYQRQIIKQALEQNDGVWARAAAQLQMNRSNLHRLAKRLGLLQ